jgi:hypothetical protein
MKYGDVMYGCRFNTVKPLVIEDDVWIVGHCLVSPVKIGARSMAMLGSLVTRDMEPDRTYAGSPATDVTEKVGKQIEITSAEERVNYLNHQLQIFADRHQKTNVGSFAKVVTDREGMGTIENGVTVFNPADRTYRKNGTHLEYRLVRFLLPDAKFLPM